MWEFVTYSLLVFLATMVAITIYFYIRKEHKQNKERDTLQTWSDLSDALGKTSSVSAVLSEKLGEMVIEGNPAYPIKSGTMVVGTEEKKAKETAKKQR